MDRKRNFWSSVARGESGQSLTELALVLPIVVLLLIGVVDVGFVLYAHTQVAAAAGEGARVGSRILINPDLPNPSPGRQTQDWNDGYRRQEVQSAVTGAMGFLSITDPTRFKYGTFSSLSLTDDTPADSDIIIEYLTLPGTDSRTGEPLVVTVRYRQPMILPFPLFSVGPFQVSTSSRVRLQ